MNRIIVLLMVLGLSLSVSAQRGNRSIDPKKRAKTEVDNLKKQLKLNDKQEKDCYNLHVDHYKKQQEIFKNKGDRNKMMEQMKKRRIDFHKKMKSILTKEQYTMYQNILKEKMRKMRESRGGERGRSKGGRGRGRGRGMGY